MDEIEARTIRKVMWRLMPFLVVCYFVAYLDRVNVGFAKLQMNAALGLSEAAYGFGAGLFFISYFLLEVPSNLALDRFGARLWIARIMFSWAVISALFAFIAPISAATGISNEWVFYILRFLLGIAEAGFFPGIIFYLTYWYPARERAKAYAWFLAAIPICGVVGSPISGALLGLDGYLGLEGWQWLFLLEGIPSVIVGLLVLRLLPDRPRDARWLAPAERSWLEATLEAEGAHAAAGHGISLKQSLGNPMVWWLGLTYFLLVVALYGFALWLPQLIKASGTFTNFQVGVITAIPYAIAAVGMVLVGRRSDRTGERHFHLALPALAGAVGFVAVTRIGSPGPLVAALSLTAFGVLGWLGPFWSMPTAILKEQAAAGGIALVNSMGAVGGFVGPYVLGQVKQQTGSFTGGLLILGACLVAAVVIVMELRRRSSV